MELDPSFMRNYTLQASCHRYLGEFDKADASIKEVLSRYPEELRIKLLYARLLIWKGQYVEAEETIESVEDADPTFPELRYLHALSLAVRGKNSEALSLYKVSTLIHFLR